MASLEIEWDFYLQAFRLHQGLSKGGSAEAHRLLRRSFDLSLKNKRSLPRAYGLQSFTIQNMWLSNWIDEDGAQQILNAAIEDVSAVVSIHGLPREILDNLQKIDSELNSKIRAVVLAYASVAAALDSKDYDNRWSLGTANLYAKNFSVAFAEYEEAQRIAQESGAPDICVGSLRVDYADLLFFAGDPSLNTSAASYIAAIRRAIDLVENTIRSNPDDPKRHRWYWTLGWAYYELGGYTDDSNDYWLSLETLQRIRNPHHLILKNLIATNAALGLESEAKKYATEFRLNNKKYTLDVEDRWPYRCDTQRERWKEHLCTGGLG